MEAQNIITALEKLDAQNDEHWTNDGLPKVDALGIKDLKRADITAVAPHFTRDNLKIELPDEMSSDEEAEQKLLDDAMSEVLEYFEAMSFKVDPDAEGEETVFILMDKDEKDFAKGTLAQLQEQMQEEIAKAAKEEEETNDADEERVQEGDEKPSEEEIVQKEVKQVKDSEEVVELQEAMQEAIDAIAEQEKVVQEEQKQLDLMRKEYDKIVDALNKSTGNVTNQQNIMNYLERQKQIRQNRVNQVTMIQQQLGVTQSPIDAAMARKTGHGNERPVRPPMTQTEK